MTFRDVWGFRAYRGAAKSTANNQIATIFKGILFFIYFQNPLQTIIDTNRNIGLLTIYFVLYCKNKPGLFLLDARTGGKTIHGG